MLGAVASGYHGADRSSWLRPVMRKLDYYTICYTSTVLRRAAHISLPNVVKAAAVLIAPFKPTVVTGLNLALVEVSTTRTLCHHRSVLWLRRAVLACVYRLVVGSLFARLAN